MAWPVQYGVQRQVGEGHAMYAVLMPIPYHALYLIVICQRIALHVPLTALIGQNAHYALCLFHGIQN